MSDGQFDGVPSRERAARLSCSDKPGYGALDRALPRQDAVPRSAELPRSRVTNGLEVLAAGRARLIIPAR